MPSEEEEQDDLIDPIIDATPVFNAIEPVMSHARRQAFTTDLARKIDLYPTIAVRYGFVDEQDMAEYLRARPELMRQVKQERAVWFSSENAEIRNRTLAQRATTELIPEAAQIGLNENINPSVRLEALNRLARIAGVDGPGSRAGEGFSNAPDAGGRFSVQIVFSGANRTETISVSPANPVANPVVPEGNGL
jgi:hypothetical protein